MKRSRSRRDTSRDPGSFVALPWPMLDSAAYRGLSHTARSLLVEIARQHRPSRNGQMKATPRYLATRGWTSRDVITRGLRELRDAGLIYLTVRGMRPNRAAWYAVTWYDLDPHPDYDAGVVTAYRRAPYRDLSAEISEQIHGASLVPPDGTVARPIVPSHGTERPAPIPSDGTIRPHIGTSPVPPDGHHLV